MYSKKTPIARTPTKTITKNTLYRAVASSASLECNYTPAVIKDQLLAPLNQFQHLEIGR
ncbi:hypothetical protein [Paenalcaligenes faecalis]|uniref:hypothetical protein n=1 Tax=Paenalcaligenes faecalis TaxID=2980099 RepID=UPI0022B94FDB|nr:hypothetical protein [Paenalcaligenes faecalis]